VEGRPAGIARYVRIPDGPADLAFEVADAQQGRGLGSLLLDAVATVARANAVNRVSATVRLGSVYHEVLSEAETIGADLVVVGSHRPSMSTYLLGSNAATIVRHAKCSVLVVRNDPD